MYPAELVLAKGYDPLSPTVFRPLFYYAFLPNNPIPDVSGALLSHSESQLKLREESLAEAGLEPATFTL